jgi:signal transduction histidine kinase
MRFFYPFFTIAILEAGVQGGLRRTMAVATVSVVLWLAVVSLVDPGKLLPFIMRPIYLLVVGYLVGYLGEQRLRLHSEIHLRETAEQRAHIGRELHDGYLQVLGAANLQLESCRQLLRAGRPGVAQDELAELQRAINAEHDELRFYARSLAAAGPANRAGEVAPDTRISMRIDVDGSGALLEHVLRILSEGVTNVRRHSAARSATIRADRDGGALSIVIDDDGRGFADDEAPPWSIASRVRQLGGVLRVSRDVGPGAHLQISLPTEPCR